MTIQLKTLKRTILGLITLAFGGLASIATTSAYTSSATTTVTVTINPVINITDGNSGTTTLAAITPTSAGRMSSSTDSLAVTTNDVSGYTVTIQMAGATNTLVSGGNSIAASAATTGTPAALVVGSGTAAPTGAWGFCVPSGSGNGSYTTSFVSCDGTLSSAAISSGKYAPVPVSGSPFTLFDTSSSSVGSYNTVVTFGAAVNNGQASGTYTGTVVFTAITK